MSIDETKNRRRRRREEIVESTGIEKCIKSIELRQTSRSNEHKETIDHTMWKWATTELPTKYKKKKEEEEIERLCAVRQMLGNWRYTRNLLSINQMV